MPFVDEAGNIWADDQKTLIQAAGGAAAPMTFGTPDPSIPKKEAREDRRDARAESKDERDAIGFQTQQQNAALDRELKQLQIQAERAKAGGAGGIKKVQQLVAQINRVQQLYDTSIGKTKGIMGAVDYLPTDDAKRFDTAGAQLSQIGLAAFRTPGTGTVSDRDAIMFDKGNLPQASTRDAAIEEILGGLKRRVEEEYEAAGQPAPTWSNTQQRADNEVPGQDNGAALKAGTAPVDPGPMPPANSPGGGNPPTPWDQPNPTGGMTVATGPTRTIHSDRLSAQIDAMMNAGASKAMIDTVLKQQGFPPVDPSTFTAATKWMKENPGQKYFGANVNREEPLGLMARAAGSAPGAFVAQMADAATAGTVGALAGDKGQGALDAMDQVSPNASLAGTLVGGVTGAGMAEVGAGMAAPSALAKYAPRIGDALYGALSGFNGAKDGEGAQGAALGAGAGVVGGAIGQGVMKGVGAAARGVTNPAAQYLRAQGVPLTVGQTLGGVAKGIEDKATSIPLVGDMIARRRAEGLEAFNQAAFKEALEPIGGTVNKLGEQGVDEALDQVGGAYDNALGAVNLSVDPEYKMHLGQAVQAANRLPQGLQDQFHATLGERVGQMFNGQQIDGKGLQAALKGLNMDAASLTRRSEPMADVFSARANDVGDALMGMAERQAPGTPDAIQAANRAYRQVGVVGDANLSAPSQPYFTPAQLDRASINNTRKFGGRNAAASGDRPFFDLTQAGKEVLPSSVPDSGTAGRLMNVAMLGGAGAIGGGAGYAAGDTGAGSATGLGLALAAMVGGSKGAQALATKALLDRPDLALKVGRQLVDNSRIGSWTGAGTLAPLLVGQ